MGSDADVREFDAVRVGAMWCAPVQIVPPTKEDKATQEAEDKKAAAIARAKAAGLSDDDLKLLGAKP
jgi:hypothetical protein